jgi:hypothetical protein
MIAPCQEPCNDALLASLGETGLAAWPMTHPFPPLEKGGQGGFPTGRSPHRYEARCGPLSFIPRGPSRRMENFQEALRPTSDIRSDRNPPQPPFGKGGLAAWPMTHSYPPLEKGGQGGFPAGRGPHNDEAPGSSHSVMPGVHARGSCPGFVPGVHARGSCSGFVPGVRARGSCLGVRASGFVPVASRAESG